MSRRHAATPRERGEGLGRFWKFGATSAAKPGSETDCQTENSMLFLQYR